MVVDGDILYVPSVLFLVAFDGLGESKFRLKLLYNLSVIISTKRKTFKKDTWFCDHTPCSPVPSREYKAINETKLKEM